jgi:hypothetical protein
LILLASAPVDAIARPANRPARGDSSEAKGARRAPTGWISLLVGHQASLAGPISAANRRRRGADAEEAR